MAYLSLYRLRILFFWGVYSFTRRHLREKIDFIFNEHERGLRILRDNAANDSPFLLHLRSFELEVQSVRYDRGRVSGYWESAGKLVDDNSTNEAIMRFASGANTRADLAQAVGDRIPVLSLGNASDPLLTLHPTNSLHLPQDNWEESVQYLIAKSAVIVFEISSFTSGIIPELKHIQSLGGASKTFVVLSGPLKRRKRPDFPFWNNEIDRFMQKISPADAKRAQALLKEMPRVTRRAGRSWEETLAKLGFYEFIDQTAVTKTQEEHDE